MYRRIALACAVVVLAAGAPRAAHADSPIVYGAGSTWSQVAVDQWRADVNRFGIRVNYSGVGSSAGRSYYIQNNVDFAVSEIPFQPAEVNQLKESNKSYVYLPIVAGGTSLMYNLRDASGNAVTDLRLSPATITGVFTGSIKDWSDPAIATDNNGRPLPSQPIVPVVRSDGSGTSAQFTAFMAKMTPDAWCAFAKRQQIDCAFTSNYPDFQGSVSQSGSDGVANFVHSESSGKGAITYVETAYALQRGRPVAFVKNASGNYTLPTSKNVSTALQAATLYADKTQNLDGVYTNPDPVTYPISNYSYMIVPTRDLATDKGAVLGKFMAYFACDGQRKADLLGYSPLPRNLVEVVFDAIRQVPGAPAPPPIDDCNNPTIKGDSSAATNNNAGKLSGGSSQTGAVTSTGASAASAAPRTVSAPTGAAPSAASTAAKGAAAGAGGGVGATTGLPASVTTDVGAAADGAQPVTAYATGPLPKFGPKSFGTGSQRSLVASGFVLLMLVFGPVLFSRRRKPNKARSSSATTVVSLARREESDG